MNTISNIGYFTGMVFIETDRNLESLGKQVGVKCLGGLCFGGEDDYIYDEMPAIYIKGGVLGMNVTLSQIKSGLYCLDTSYSLYKEGGDCIDLSSYLYVLCKNKLECDDIKILSEEEADRK